MLTPDPVVDMSCCLEALSQYENPDYQGFALLSGNSAEKGNDLSEIVGMDIISIEGNCGALRKLKY